MVKLGKILKKTGKHIFHTLHKWLKNKHLRRNVLLFCLGAFVLFAGIIVIWISSLNIPDFTSFDDRKLINSTKIYDRTGEILLYDIHQDVKRTNIDFEKMGENIREATVAIEDAEFYNHNGIRVSSTIRAVFSNIFHIGIGGGGSTITQQLVKNTLLKSGSGFGRYVRKMKEWVLAVKIDKSLSKDQILEAYLNEVPYGGTIYGIQEASMTYFNKKPIDLSLAEAAYLAAVPQSPTLLSPFGKNRDKLDTRKNLVLSQMRQGGFITPEEYEAAKSEVVTFAAQATTGIKAPHFVFFIKEYLEEKYGSEVVEEGGLRVTTTIDYKLQELGEQFVEEGALKNDKDWGGENAALVAIDPKTGQILTMVGSRDYFDKEIDGNFNVATAVRQPGSSFKPFIYATAFNKGFTPETVLFDLPTEFQTTCDAYGRATAGHRQSDCYMPKNYDGAFRGPMSLRDALAQSINVPAVKLFYLSGLSDSLKTAEDMGISTLGDVGRYGLTLVIGGGEVSLLDMTSSYGVFANSGSRSPYTGILKIENRDGDVLEEYHPNGREVLPRNTALTISDILKDNVARTPTFGANSPLVVSGRQVAVKTGTTDNNKDAWILGYTPSLVAGVWAGNNDNTPMKKGGAALAGPIWNRFMNEALKNFPNEQFEEPIVENDPRTLKPVLRGFWQGNESFFVDKITGKLASELTPPETIEEKVVTNVHSILYWVDRNNVLGPPPADPTANPQFNHFEIPIQNWWAQNQGRFVSTTWDQVPKEVDDVHTENSKPSLNIQEPTSRKTYSPNERIDLRFTSTGPYSLQKIDIFINDVFVDSLEAPFSFSFKPEDIESIEPVNQMRVVSYDTLWNQGETIQSFRVR